MDSITKIMNWELFRDNDITIAFPQQDVHLDGTLILEGTDQESGKVTPAKQDKKAQFS